MIKDQTHTNNFDKDIIVRFLEGYATKEEETSLSAWLNTSEENKIEFRETKEIWDMALISKEMNAVDVDADWKKVSSKISEKSTTNTTAQLKAKTSKKSKQNKKKKGTTKKQPAKAKSQPKQEAKIKKMNFTRWIGGIAAGLAILVAAYFVLQNVGNSSSNQTGPARTMVLADGTKVWLNRDGDVKAPKEFIGNDRIVYLTGEAFFDVAHDAKKPFRIICVNTEVRVLGTAFNVRTNERITDVMVEEGQVQLINDERGSKSIIVNPGEVGMSNVLGTTKIPNNRPNYHSWRSGKFSFDNTPLKFAIRDLNGWYDKEIILSGNFDCNVTASFNNATQAEIIESLKGPCNFKVLEYPNDPNHKDKIYLKKVK